MDGWIENRGRKEGTTEGEKATDQTQPIDVSACFNVVERVEHEGKAFKIR